MASSCENCGCRVYSGRCVNCHEELYILDKYIDQCLDLPGEDSNFMKAVRTQTKQVAQARKKPDPVGFFDEMDEG